jgi:hypothetical protein
LTEREIAVLDRSMRRLLSVKTVKLATHAEKALGFRRARRQRLHTISGFAVTAIFAAEGSGRSSCRVR